MKQHIPSTLRGALIAAGVLAGASAWAITPGAASNDLQAPPTKPSASMTQGSDYGNAADKKKAPSREDVMRDANRPSTSVLDDNAQRQHDPNQAVNPNPSGSNDSNAGRTENPPSAYPHDEGTTPGQGSSDKQ
jgi:hypothetical protein